jgi:large subunit ribosomal protein L10
VNRQEKEEKVQRWHDIFAKVEGAVFTGLKGMTVAQSTELRKRFRDADIGYEVVKNTLARRAVKETSLDSAVELFDGPTALAWHYDDPAAPARIAQAYAKENDKFEIRGGYASGKVLDKVGVKALSTMPTFDELRAQLLGVINGVGAKLLSQINAPSQHLVGVVQARKDDLEEKEKAA